MTIGTGGQLRATLRAGDARAEHIRSVLRLSPGDSLSVGVIGGLAANATLLASPSDGAAAPGGSALELEWAVNGGQEARLERPGVDLLLALPRPKVLRRMWCQLAALGVGAVYLTNAAKARNPQPALRMRLLMA